MYEIQNFYLRGKISDKGGFNWELRVNESVVDKLFNLRRFTH